MFTPIRLTIATCLCVSIVASEARAQTRSQADTLRLATRVGFDASHATATVRSLDSSMSASALDAGDPSGFVRILNSYRASAGLPPVAFDPELSAWASQNNVAQCRKGIGHHVNPKCFQNSAWNYSSAFEVAQGWMRSTGHRRNMLSPAITRVGIAYGPGPYWTMNAR